MSGDFYEILGVGRDATDEDLKRARRRLAAQHHPDRGGSVEKMAEANEAYEVLSNPQRRIQYDGSGKLDPLSSIEETARDVFLQALRSAVDAPDGGLDTAMRSAIENMRDQVITGRAGLVASREALIKRRGQVVTDEGVINFVHEVIDVKLKSIETNLANCEESLEVMALVEEMWSHYHVDEYRAPNFTRTSTSFFSSSTTSSSSSPLPLFPPSY